MIFDEKLIQQQQQKRLSQNKIKFYLYGMPI